ncbi:MAG: type III-A CRISPR-associated protein Csm2 [bacterium]|nr:type III-A CRISPR-associated protein Csm2 [bacterium]
MNYNQPRGGGNRNNQHENRTFTNSNPKSENTPAEPLTEENYVELAEKAIKAMKKEGGKKGSALTTSKIRNLLSMSMDLYNDIRESKEEKLNKELVGRINYLKVRVVYEAGREESVKRFQENAHLLYYITEIKDSKKKYLLFSRYMEALVAYHKFEGGRD